MTPTAYRGTVQAAAFVIDVPLVGEDEARRRVMEMWRPGTTVRATADAHWLVILGQPMLIRSEQAPGLPLVAAERGLVQPGLHAEPDTVVLSRHGRTNSRPLATLSTVPLTGWLDLADLPVHRLTCLDRPAEAAPIVEIPVQAEPDLRAAAKVGLPSPKARRLARNRGPSPATWAVLAGIVAIVVGLGLAIVALVALVALGRVDYPVGPIAFAMGWLIFAVVAAAIRRPADGSGTSSTGRGPPQWLTTLLLRSPAGRIIRGKHARYLHKLSEQFRQRQWDEALRDAVGLGSGDGRGSTWRIPRRRTSITPTLSWAAGGPSVAYGPGVYYELHNLYRKAADDLEKAGRIEQAAFVHADLLDDPAAAVNVLERHGHLRLAAELAEGRDLDPDLVVRLWWRFGRRDRAITVARARGAFAGAVDRLSTVDPEAATELRREWVASCQQAGDHLAAVEAAWPDEGLRPMVVDDIRAGIARRGPTAARLTAYLLTADPAPAVMRQALELVADTSAEHQPERDEFVSALATLATADVAADRQISTAALRSIVRDGLPDGESRAATRRAVRSLENRADPLAVADTTTLTSRRRRQTRSPLRLTAPREPGQLQVHDVATLPDGSILVSHGNLGARLLTADGRVRARWDVPTHRLVLADHSGTALLLSIQGSLTEVHRLDLDSRRV